MLRIRISRLRSLSALALMLVTPQVLAEGLPKDVNEFLEQRELCAHFRQEPWPEGKSSIEMERRTFIAAQIVRFCTGLNETELNLRGKYRDQRTVIQELDKHEANGSTQ